MSTPRINPNDPQWTAYVLGELDDDGAAVERLLDASPDARQLVDDLRMTCATVAEALEAETSPALNPAQRAAVRRAAETSRRRRVTRLPMPWVWSIGAVAAAVIAAFALRSPTPSPQPHATDRSLIAASTVSPTAENQTGSSAARGGEQTGHTGREQTPASTPSAATSTAALTVQRPTVTAEAAPGVATQANAATGTVTLSGMVRDRVGAGLPGVKITATDPTSGAAITAFTDGTGRYTFTNLDAGRRYRLAAALPGFDLASADVALDRVSAAKRDFEMSVSPLAETIVTVTGDTPVVDLQARQAPAPAPAGPSAAKGLANGVGGGIVGGAALGDRAARRSDTTGFPSAPPPRFNTESYAAVRESTFVRVSQEPLATFSIDVDTASYSNVRRFLTQNQLPPADAVRIEELVNYFTYDYAKPSGSNPIAASIAATPAPWNPEHRLVRIGVKAREIEAGRRPPSNLVFLIDVSGSMNMPQKLPLVKSSLKMLVDQLGENDRVSIVVYAGMSGLVLPPTSGDHKDVIARALDNLEAGGSTNGGAGIQLAYRQATENFIRGGVNRVILMTDGDFNVGITGQGELTRLIEARAKSGVFLSVLGFGMGNLKDSTMERLADTGNGQYGYIDTINEARKMLVEQMNATLVTVAKDVKIQVDFNPAKVEAYRLIGYENRALRPEDFNNDLKDAGDMGAGHTVTALFEVIPSGGTVPGSSIDPSVFQAKPRNPPASASRSNDMLVLRTRYKLPDAAESTRMDVPFTDRNLTFSSADADFRFAASVAAFGMILKESPYRGNATLEWVLDTATSSRGKDQGGYRTEFVSLVQKAVALSARRY